MSWETVIGLEVHCQLKTETKLFCGCRNAFGEPPNTLTCPVCTGQPGALPVLNSAAVELAVRAAVALDCEVAAWSRFDRKNYFYCDLPKGYQISQYDQPYCSGGGIRLASGKTIRLTRIHMEEDAGKAIHDRGEGTLVDLNRAGVPLIESVTEPDLASPDEAYEYLTRLKEILRFAGVSDCDMEKGSLRCDVNISVRRPGEPLGEKVELKNLNSFRNVRDASEIEVARQIAVLSGGGEIVQETRLFDVDRQETRTMRTKEDAEDYRYFPEPDLPPLTLARERIDAARAALPEAPEARRTRYVDELGLSEYDAGVLTGDPAVADFFEAAAAASKDAKAAANWISNEVLAALGDDEVPGDTVDGLRLAPDGLAELIALVGDGTLSSTAGKKVLRGMLVSGTTARDEMRTQGLEQMNDEAELEALVRAAAEGREAVLADIRGGNKKAAGALFGPVMKASGGRANPRLVQAIIQRIADEGA
ncbi:MAG: Asp-tRNA(Asn)/Glu-tRNA(Gln) amidotransferase subunit GatB [Planctomycetota bacterium]